MLYFTLYNFSDKSIMMFWTFAERVLMFNRFEWFWSEGYQRGSQVAFRPKAAGSNYPVIQRLQVRILREDNFFALLVLSSRRSGGSSQASALGAFRPGARKTIKCHPRHETKIKNMGQISKQVLLYNSDASITQQCRIVSNYPSFRDHSL